jgi:NAD-dependent dihydropyrimidine dehydrogenase PreA subunit
MNMTGKTVIMRFTGDSAGQPVVSRTLRRFDIEVNITRAYISPEEEGHMTAVFSGEEGTVDLALEFLRSSGVLVTVAERRLVMDEDLCTACTACTGQCPTGALSVDREDMTLVFRNEECISCGICIPACPYGALSASGAGFGTGGAV